MTTLIRSSFHVLHEEDKMIYRIKSHSEFGSETFGLLYTLELVAGNDYIKETNTQGYVPADNFIEDAQEVDFTVYPLVESLGERLKDEGFKVIDINKFKIHY